MTDGAWIVFFAIGFVLAALIWNATIFAVLAYIAEHLRRRRK